MAQEYQVGDGQRGCGILAILLIVALAVVGGGIALARSVYTSRQEARNAKTTSEAMSTIAAIARGAVAAYEREPTGSELRAGGANHRLCGSALPVPPTVPKEGDETGPSSAPGEGFQTGDENTGWKCLRFELTTPTYYQYEYRVGGNYKGPARGGPDPGPDGFEVSAEGDLDGDGKTSLFTVVGHVNRTTGTVRTGEEMFIVDELE